MCTLANSEDSDEMPHSAAFHQGLHCLLRENLFTIYFENYNRWPLYIYNRPSQVNPEALELKG